MPTYRGVPISRDEREQIRQHEQQIDGIVAAARERAAKDAWFKALSDEDAGLLTDEMVEQVSGISRGERAQLVAALFTDAGLVIARHNQRRRAATATVAR
jgi:hypothetical protein